MNCSGGLRPATARLGHDGQERRGELFVKGKKEFHALAVGVERFGAIAFLHGAIQFGVGAEQFGRHGERIVKVGECGGGELLAHVQHGLRPGFHGGTLLVRHVRRQRVETAGWAVSCGPYRAAFSPDAATAG